MAIVYNEKEAFAAVSTYVASTERRKKIRLRTYKTNVPGHLDFNTPRVRGQIVHSDRSLTAADLRRIIEKHSKNDAKRESVIVITAGTFACDPREFHLWPLLHIDPTGATLPCNNSADKFNRIYQTQQNRAALFELIPVAMLAIIVLALLSLAGVVSGPTSTVAITLGAIIFVVGATLAISGPLAGFAGLSTCSGVRDGSSTYPTRLTDCDASANWPGGKTSNPCCPDGSSIAGENLVLPSKCNRDSRRKERTSTRSRPLTSRKCGDN